MCPSENENQVMMSVRLVFVCTHFHVCGEGVLGGE